MRSRHAGPRQPTTALFSLNNCGAAGQRSWQRHLAHHPAVSTGCKGGVFSEPSFILHRCRTPRASTSLRGYGLARRATRRATTAADGDGAGTSSSLLMLCLLRKRRSSLLISLPFSPFISAPFSLLFRQPPHICFLPFFTNVPSRARPIRAHTCSAITRRLGSWLGATYQAARKI